MKFLKHLSLATVAFSTLLVSCTTETFETINQPTVAISDVESTTTSTVNASFTPDASCTSYIYAIGSASDREIFAMGGIEGTEEATEAVDVTFEGLEADTEYTIYALAYGAEGAAEGSLSSFVVRTYNATCSAKLQYAGPNRAGVVVKANSSVMSIDYALDVPGKAAAFANGDLSSIRSATETLGLALNYNNLTQDTEYTFYYRFYDRAGGKSEVHEVSVCTTNPVDDPYVELVIGESNIYESKYKFVPNDKCSEYYFLAGAANTYSQIFNKADGYAGDIYSMMLNWRGEDWGLITVEGGEHAFSLSSTELKGSQDMEFYVLACDLDGNPVSVQEFEFTTAAASATGEAEVVDIEMLEVSSYSAKFEITPNEHTFSTFYSIFTKGTYDSYWSTDIAALQEKLYGDFVQQVQFDHAVVWTMGNEPFIYSEEYGLDAETSYYVVAIPMNGLGLSGWGEPKVYEFTTEPM